jgi:ribosomal protein L11 methyltransferase
MADWVEIVVTVDDARAEDVAAAVAPNGAQLRVGEVVFWVDVADAESAVAAARAAIAPFHLAPSAVRAQPAVPEQEWRDAWKRYFRVERLTPRIVIVPSWETYQPVDGDVVLHLDPGQAFGTGAHASTQLCLTALDGAPPVDRFFDLGTGSGILSIAAAKLWPNATGLAIDVDPLAVDAATENCARNGVGDRVECSGRPLARVDEAFPLVLANIQAVVHLQHVAAIVERVAPGGALVLSGLLSGEVDGVAGIYVAAGMTLDRIVRSDRDPEWSAAHLRALA